MMCLRLSLLVAAAGAAVAGVSRTSCTTALQTLCGAQRPNRANCGMCVNGNAAKLRQAGCTEKTIGVWCGGASPPAPPSSLPFPESRLITPAQGVQLNAWANQTGSWELCYDSFTMSKTTAEFHRGCDQFAPTVTVAHNSGGRGVCGQCKNGKDSCGDAGSCDAGPRTGSCYHPPCTCRAPSGGTCSSDGANCWPVGAPCGSTNPGNFTFGGYVRPRLLAPPPVVALRAGGSDPPPVPHSG